jgi:hypothetical protein
LPDAARRGSATVSPAVDLDTDTTPAIIKIRIDAFVALDPEIRIADGRRSGFKTTEIKNFARFYGIPTTLALIAALVERHLANRALDTLRAGEQSGGTHKWTHSSFSRYCNFLFTYPDALEHSQLAWSCNLEKWLKTSKYLWIQANILPFLDHNSMISKSN